MPSITIQNAPPAEPQIVPRPFPDVIFGSTEIETSYNRESRAAVGGPPTTFRGSQTNNGLTDPAAFQNLRSLSLPYAGYSGNRSYAGMRDAIDLCVRAWTGFPPARNAVEVSVEFSCQPLTIKSNNLTVQTFFREWWTAIKGPSLLEQAMRAYYREGNVFWYAFFGKFGPAYYKNYQQSFAAKENKIPIRYELLNPTNVFVPTGLTFPYTYVRLLSTYEVERLKTPLTVQDKQVYNDLPAEVKNQLKVGNAFPLGIWLPMSSDRLRFMFYKKQDYEPLAVPMLWPVLPDIEWKLALKKMDVELARKVEHAILLVTTGEAPSQFNGGNGINQNNIARLQNLFTNQTLTRYLVADYTTKASWLIPDVKEILGSEKYKVVNEDIREGLQSILTGDDKFANAQIKAKIFIQRLEEGQQKFLNDFLMIEIQRICDTMGFRTIPEVSFPKIDLQDEAVMSRIIAQLAQIGVLTAPQAVRAIETGVLPDQSEMEQGQEEYKKARDKGLYEPLIGGQKDDGSGPNGRPAGSGGGKQAGPRKSSPMGKSKAAWSIKAYTEHLRASQSLATAVDNALCKRFKIKEIAGDPSDPTSQRAIADTLVRIIISTEPKDKWIKAVAGAIKQPPQIPVEIGRELDELMIEHGVDGLDAALLRWCRTEAPQEQ